MSFSVQDAEVAPHSGKAARTVGAHPATEAPEKGYWYISTPYSKFKGGLEQAFYLAVRARGLLIKAGVPAFSPIIHSHPVAMACHIDPHDHSIWLPAEAPIMVNAKGLIMVMAEGWLESYGMAEEKKFFEAAGKPIIYMTPGEVPKGLT